MRLAALDLAAGVVTEVFVAPPGYRPVFTLNICNRSAGPAKVRVALTEGAPPSAADWIEYDTPIPAAGSVGGSVLERTGLALNEGQKLFVHVDAAGVSAVVFGFREPI